ncbi:MAG TPA: hypothetical protein VGN12_29190 [Pirellulales bacterium]|jgi:hypothetical protein
MAEFVEAKRVVVIAESVLLKDLLSKFVELGAKGYNAMYCFGKGEHGIVDDLFNSPDRSCVRIEMITTIDVASALMDYVHRDAVQRYPVTAFVDTVMVDSRDTFFRR